MPVARLLATGAVLALLPAGLAPMAASGHGATVPAAAVPAAAVTSDRAPAAAHAVPSRGGVRLAPTARGVLSGRTVVVDPGHNARVTSANSRLVPAGNGRRKPCNTSGTASRSGASEHAFTWEVATKLTRALRARGATVVLTRPNDRGVGPCVDERAAIVNRARADLLLSIHADGNLSPRARGFHVITSTTMLGGRAVENESMRLARTLRSTFATMGMPRSTYLGGGTAITPRRDIAGLNLIRHPGVMLEAGNMRHPRDAAMLASPRFRTKASNALADAATLVLTRR